MRWSKLPPRLQGWVDQAFPERSDEDERGKYGNAAGDRDSRARCKIRGRWMRDSGPYPPGAMPSKVFEVSSRGDWITFEFDSIAERAHYDVLKMALDAGQIIHLGLQPRYPVFDSFHDPIEGKRIRGITYTPDFIYQMDDGSWMVEDVKGALTEGTKIRVKLWKFRYPTMPFRFIDAGLYRPRSKRKKRIRR